MDVVNLTPDGFPVNGIDTLCYVSEDGKTLHMNVPAYKIMITAEADLDNLPDELPPGTEAFLADESGKWRKAADGNWESMIHESTTTAESDP